MTNTKFFATIAIVALAMISTISIIASRSNVNTIILDEMIITPSDSSDEALTSDDSIPNC